MSSALGRFARSIGESYRRGLGLKTNIEVWTLEQIRERMKDAKFAAPTPKPRSELFDVSMIDKRPEPSESRLKVLRILRFDPKTSKVIEDILTKAEPFPWMAHHVPKPAWAKTEEGINEFLEWCAKAEINPKYVFGRSSVWKVRGVQRTGEMNYATNGVTPP